MCIKRLTISLVFLSLPLVSPAEEQPAEIIMKAPEASTTPGETKPSKSQATKPNAGFPAQTSSDADQKIVEVPLPPTNLHPEVDPMGEYVQIKKNVIYFNPAKNDKSSQESTPEPIETNLFELIFFSILPPPFEDQGARPWVLVSALPCETCVKRRMLYLIRDDGKKAMSFVHPGTIRKAKSGKLVYDGRSFYGNCLRKKGQVLVSFQKDKIDRRRYLQSSVFAAEIGNNEIKESLLLGRRKPSLKHTIRRVKKKECAEIKGLSRSSDLINIQNLQISDSLIKPSS